MMKTNFLSTLLLFFAMTIHAQEKIKLYAFYTPSHEFFVQDWFLPSIQDDYEIILECHKQECRSGEFMKDGWKKCMLRKIDLIIRGIKENWGNIFIHSDVDIQFLAPTKDLILKAIEDNDIVIQRNRPGNRSNTLCAGFFACRGNKKTLQLWQAIRNYVVRTKNNDQDGLNYFLKKNNYLKIKWDYLPSIFYAGGTITGKIWNPGMNLPIPEGIVLHHANWTIGIENKIKQLKYVKGKVTPEKH